MGLDNRSAYLKDDNTLAFLASYAKKYKEEIQPQFRHGVGIIYEIENADISFERIKSYEQEKLLSITGSKSYSACPRCKSLLLSLRLSCPDCKKHSLAKSEIMVHYGCEYSGPVEEFVSQEDNEYVCPKCSQGMKRVGIEYGRPGIGFTCQDCKRVFQYPLVNAVCHNGHELRVDEIDLQHFPTYRINEEIQNFAEVAEYFTSIQQALVDKGLEAYVLSKIRGESGITHIMPLIVRSRRAHVVVDFILDESGFDAKILQKILRGADLSKYIMLLFVPEGIISRLAPIVNKEKIRLVPLSGKNMKMDPLAIAEEVFKVAE
jgi:transposase-like protein